MSETLRLAPAQEGWRRYWLARGEMVDVSFKRIDLHAQRVAGRPDYALNDAHALVSRHWVGRRLPPDVRDRVFRMLVDYRDDQQ